MKALRGRIEIGFGLLRRAIASTTNRTIIGGFTARAAKHPGTAFAEALLRDGDVDARRSGSLSKRCAIRHLYYWSFAYSALLA